MLALPFKKKERKRKTKHKEKEKEDREGGGKEKGNDREKERRKERKVRGRVETPLICELGTSGLEILAFPRYPIAFFVFLFFSFFKRDSRRESSLVPNHAIGRTTTTTTSKPWPVPGEKRRTRDSARCLYCQWENDYPKIIPLLLSLFIVIPRRYVPTTVRVLFLDSRSITKGF